nr:hypothetical protein [Tanacetum cinerariifolium]
SSSSLALLKLPSDLVLLPSALVLLPSAMSFTTSLSICSNEFIQLMIGSCITIPLALGVVDVVTVVDVVLVALTCTLSSFTIAFLFFKAASALANVISSIEITGVVAAALTSTPIVVTTSLAEVIKSAVLTSFLAKTSSSSSTPVSTCLDHSPLSLKNQCNSFTGIKIINDPPPFGCIL